MQLDKGINGRTPERWAAYDRAKLIGAVTLGLLLLVPWLAGHGPASAVGCCEPPAAAAASPQPGPSRRGPDTLTGAPAHSRAMCCSRRTARS